MIAKRISAKNMLAIIICVKLLRRCLFKMIMILAKLNATVKPAIIFHEMIRGKVGIAVASLLLGVIVEKATVWFSFVMLYDIESVIMGHGI